MFRTSNPAEMARRGRIGAHRLHATHDPRETTRAARAGLLRKFELEVDPNSELAPEERAALAEKLLESVDSLEQDKIEAAWAEEANRRIEAYRQGKMKLLPGEQVIESLLDETES